MALLLTGLAGLACSRGKTAEAPVDAPAPVATATEPAPEEREETVAPSEAPPAPAPSPTWEDRPLDECISAYEQCVSGFSEEAKATVDMSDEDHRKYVESIRAISNKEMAAKSCNDMMRMFTRQKYC